MEGIDFVDGGKRLVDLRSADRACFRYISAPSSTFSCACSLGHANVTANCIILQVHTSIWRELTQSWCYPPPWPKRQFQQARHKFGKVLSSFHAYSTKISERKVGYKNKRSHSTREGIRPTIIQSKFASAPYSRESGEMSHPCFVNPVGKLSTEASNRRDDGIEGLEGLHNR